MSNGGETNVQQKQQPVSLEQIELRTRRIVDELNGVITFLCRNYAVLAQENDQLKKQTSKIKNGSKK
jgi:hypothetical protein